MLKPRARARMDSTISIETSSDKMAAYLNFAVCVSFREDKPKTKQLRFLCILFSTLKYNMHIIHMGVTLAELCLLSRNTKHSQVGYIGQRCGRLF